MSRRSESGVLCWGGKVVWCVLVVGWRFVSSTSHSSPQEVASIAAFFRQKPSHSGICHPGAAFHCPLRRWVAFRPGRQEERKARNQPTHPCLPTRSTASYGVFLQTWTVDSVMSSYPRNIFIFTPELLHISMFSSFILSVAPPRSLHLAAASSIQRHLVSEMHAGKLNVLWLLVITSQLLSLICPSPYS